VKSRFIDDIGRIHIDAVRIQDVRDHNTDERGFLTGVAVGGAGVIAVIAGIIVTVLKEAK
jgi:hypothetical protein